MKTLYLDIFSGLSGDMFIGALLDLGVDSHQLEQELARLDLEGYSVRVSRQHRGHIAGTKFDVRLEGEPRPHFDRDRHQPVQGEEPEDAPQQHRHVHPHAHEHSPHHHSAPGAEHDPESLEHGHAREAHPHHHEGEGHGSSRTFADIQELIARSPLSDWVREKALAIFQRVAIAEGKIHGQPPEAIHFHEVGAVDSIVDVVGGCLALEMLGKPRVMAGPVVEGTGWVHCAHGRFPLPAPATLEILAARGVPVSQCDEPHELVTPTGAALLAELAESFGPMQNLFPLQIGYGLGTREHQTRPNVLRAVLCETAAHAAAHDWETDVVAVLQTNLDDASGELLGSFVEKALAQGALDVFHTPIHMKKNRPGVLLSLLCPESTADQFSELILRETTAFGVRRHLAERRKLRREVARAKTPYGEVLLKVGKLDGQILQTAPEYESCRRLAEQAGVALKQVYDAATRAILP